MLNIPHHRLPHMCILHQAINTPLLTLRNPTNHLPTLCFYRPMLSLIAKRERRDIIEQNMVTWATIFDAVTKNTFSGVFLCERWSSGSSSVYIGMWLLVCLTHRFLFHETMSQGA